jgi:hypothetical protein
VKTNLEKNPSQGKKKGGGKGEGTTGGMAQNIGPEFKPQYTKKNFFVLYMQCVIFLWLLSRFSLFFSSLTIILNFPLHYTVGLAMYLNI